MSIEKGHDFDFENEVCNNCGMTESKYQDSDKPKCRERKKQVNFGDDKTETKKPLKTTKFI
jgi:hypothetical protein